MIPPRELLVQKFTESRAPELESLYSTIANRLKNDFKSQRNKRRRTTSYDNRASKTRFRKKQKVGPLNQSDNKNIEKCVTKAPPRHIRRRKELNKNPQSGFCTSGDGTKRLRTHVWHAKRFTMIKQWGFHLPLGLHGRGRGSRALLKWLNNGAVVHDASYNSALQLEGSQASLLSILSTVTTPFPPPHVEKVLSGDIYANSMLHHASTPNLIIAPVIYMWRPNKLDRSSFRRLWIWIHAAAFDEGYDALKIACERQGKIDEDVAPVSCTSLEGQFGTLEVMGSKACQLLQKILRPDRSMFEKSLVLKKCSSMEAAEGDPPLTNASILEKEDQNSCCGIIYLTVSDPRGLTKECSGISETSTELESSCNDLWETGKGLCCPVEESVLCMEKHNQRLSSFCLASKSSEDVNALTKSNSSRFCPLLLLRRNNLKDSITRWSIILPLSWVKPFWVPLISNGAQAIGLRERSWIGSEVRIPCFPSEFPECISYYSLMVTKASAIDKEASLRPPSVRPFSIPVPPPWKCVSFAFGSNPTEPVGSDSDMAVARTSSKLDSFLNDINGDHFLLFTNFLDKKIPDQGLNMEGFLANQSRKMCFVRVILNAYKEGVIEEGAVVCAPRLDDIKLWKSGSNDKAKLEVAQSSVATYFVKKDSGKWEFQLPQEPVAMESHRWPIGFVTNGFVRGSKKPSAGALCEAALLAHLRHEQWISRPTKQRKKEIFVLTRNLRSTAYRLALATIVLEHRQQDLDYF